MRSRDWALCEIPVRSRFLAANVANNCYNTLKNIPRMSIYFAAAVKKRERKLSGFRSRVILLEILF